MGMIKLPEESVDFFNNNYEEIFSSGELAEGKWNQKISQWACSYTASPHSIAVNSNGAGLFSLLRVLKQYRHKKRVFLQSNTMYGVRTIAISSGLDLCGFIDCSIDFLMPSYDQVERFVADLNKPEECVFLLTHIGGWVNPDIIQIAELCKEKGISLIEDCAHSLGSTLHGKHTGLYGDAGVYSLYATKAVPAGEGGIVVTQDEALFELVSKFSMYDRFDQKLDVGVNIRMSELNALLAYSVLMRTEAIIQNKEEIAEKYKYACDQYGWRYIDPKVDGQRSNLYKFILLAQSGDPENEFSQIKHRTSPVYDYCLGADPDNIVGRHICLPIWYRLESSAVDQILVELKR